MKYVLEKRPLQIVPDATQINIWETVFREVHGGPLGCSVYDSRMESTLEIGELTDKAEAANLWTVAWIRRALLE